MKKIFAVLLAVMLLVSFAACGVDAPANDPAAAGEEGGVVATEVRGVTIPKFSVAINGITVTNEDLADYPIYSCECTSVNSKGNSATAVYQGFALSDVCAAAGLTEEYVWVSAEAADGYTVEWEQDVMANTTLLAITKDGEQFKEGPWFAPCTTETSGDILSGCVNIYVNTTAGMPDVSGNEGGEEGEAAEGGETAGLPEIKDSTANVTFSDYSFKVNGAEVTNATLEGLSIYKIKVNTTNSKGEASENTYCGYKLADVLEACGVAEAQSVKAIASDGYESELSAGQIMSDWTLVAIEKDKEVGENGAIWLAPCESEFGNTYARDVVEIIAE